MRCPVVDDPANYRALEGLARASRLYIITVTGYIYR
jgi:hypothetical protein